MTQDDKDWRNAAACAPDNRPENLDSLDFHSEERKDIRVAKSLCKTCDVRRECLSAALAMGEHHGVWGGVDQEELRRALSVNAQGMPVIRTILPKCPLCGCKVLDSIEKRRTRTLVRCTNGSCLFQWWTRRSMPKRVEKS